MTTSADILALTATALRDAADRLRAGFSTAATRFDALEALFDGPASLAIVLSPGGQAIQSQDEDLAVAEEEILVTVAHRLPPTKDPGEALWHGVGKAEAFLAILDQVRRAVQSVRLPAGSTNGFWRYNGRTETEIQGAPFPAYELRFACDLALDGSAAIHAPFSDPDAPGEPTPLE